MDYINKDLLPMVRAQEACMLLFHQKNEGKNQKIKKNYQNDHNAVYKVWVKTDGFLTG